MAIAKPMAIGIAVIATIKPALKSLYVTFNQLSLVKSSHRESKKVKNNLIRPIGVVGNFTLFIFFYLNN
jgi:hypothetical protein